MHESEATQLCLSACYQKKKWMLNDHKTIAMKYSTDHMQITKYFLDLIFFIFKMQGWNNPIYHCIKKNTILRINLPKEVKELYLEEKVKDM